MGLDRVFNTPTVTVDQDKYDDLIITRDRFRQQLKKKKRVNGYI